MKNKASGLLKLIATLRSMAKSEALALKSKTNAIKARLVIFSLVMNKRYVMSTVSDKFQSLLGHHHSTIKEVEDGNSVEKTCTLVVNDHSQLHEVVSNVNIPSECEKEEYGDGDGDGDGDGCECFYMFDDDGEGDGNKYPDLTHTNTMFESDDLNPGGSVIDLVKSSKEEAGQEFKMEDEIDHMADLFIKKFRMQILLQKQDSLKRHHDIQLQ